MTRGGISGRSSSAGTIATDGDLAGPAEHFAASGSGSASSAASVGSGDSMRHATATALRGARQPGASPSARRPHAVVTPPLATGSSSASSVPSPATAALEDQQRQLAGLLKAKRAQLQLKQRKQVCAAWMENGWLARAALIAWRMQPAI